jgi:uncharacterized protein YjaZ
VNAANSRGMQQIREMQSILTHGVKHVCR